LKPSQRALLPTGLFEEIPVGYKAQIRLRNRLAIKKRIIVLNSPGTKDADYREEIYVILINLSDENFVIMDKERICQMIISGHEKADWINTETMVETGWGTGGLGHTGKK